MKLLALPFLTRLIIVAPENLCYLPVHIFLAYSLMYWVIPRLIIPGRYVLAARAAVLVLLATAAHSAILSLTVIEYLRKGY